MSLKYADKSCDEVASEDTSRTGQSRNTNKTLESADAASSLTVVFSQDESMDSTAPAPKAKVDAASSIEPEHLRTSKDHNSGLLRAIFGFILSPKTKMICIGSVSIAIGIALWHLATEHNFHFYINFENIPSPLRVGGAFVAHLQDREFYIHVLVSLQRISIAYSIAVVLGITIGLIVGRSKAARAAVLPYIEIIRPIPAVAWIPLAILMWPTEESSIVYITFLGALFPIILNTVHGVEETPEVLVRAALSLGAKRIEVFKHVVLPSALPSIAAGLAIGMGVSWFSLLAGEIISGQYGIGYFTWNAYSLINYPDIIVGMLVIGGLGSLSTYLVGVGMSPALRWKKASH